MPRPCRPERVTALCNTVYNSVVTPYKRILQVRVILCSKATVQATGINSGHARRETSCSARPHTKMVGAAPKLKLLCLHGYMQNAEIFRSRLGSTRKALKSRVDFVFLDAPFEAQGLPGDDPEEVQGVRDGRSWWQWTDTGPAGRPSKAASYTGWDMAQSSLLAALREHQPDGLLGFSQGATAAALLLSHLAEVRAAVPSDGMEDGGGPEASQSALPRLKCAILVAGFLPRDPAVAELLLGPHAVRGGASDEGCGGGQLNRVPLLFVSGTSDTLVPPERTSQLADCFDPATVSSYTHSGAHLVPTCSGEFKSALVAFLDAVAAGGPVLALHRRQSQSALVGGLGLTTSLSQSQSGASLASSDIDAAAAPAVAAAPAAAVEAEAAVAEPVVAGVAVLTMAESVPDAARVAA